MQHDIDEYNLESISFNYNQLDERTRVYLKEKESNMAGIVNGAKTELGKELKETQDMLAKNGYGCFEEWYTGLGLKRDSVYRLINRYELIVANCDKRDMIEDLPLSLTYEMSKPSADPKLKEAVLNGDIKTHKEFKMLEDKLKASEERVAKLQKSLEDELSKPDPEPKTIEVAKTPQAVLDRLIEQESLLTQKESELTKLKSMAETGELTRKKSTLEKEIADLMQAVYKARESNDEATRIGVLMNTVAGPIRQLEKHREEIEQAFKLGVVLDKQAVNVLRLKVGFLRELADRISDSIGYEREGDIIDAVGIEE